MAGNAPYYTSDAYNHPTGNNSTYAHDGSHASYPPSSYQQHPQQYHQQHHSHGQHQQQPPPYQVPPAYDTHRHPNPNPYSYYAGGGGATPLPTRHPKILFLISITRPWAVVVPIVTLIMDVWWFSTGRICGGYAADSECYMVLWYNMPIVRFPSPELTAPREDPREWKGVATGRRRKRRMWGVARRKTSGKKKEKTNNWQAVVSLLWSLATTASARRATRYKPTIPSNIQFPIQTIIAAGATACVSLLGVHLAQGDWMRYNGLQGGLLALMVMITYVPQSSSQEDMSPAVRAVKGVVNKANIGRVVNWLLAGFAAYEWNLDRKYGNQNDNFVM